MVETAIALDWVELAVRWLHLIAAITWIGSSFYFIALDLGLRRHAGLPQGVTGEEWQVHGGGFYHVQKYAVAPPDLPEHLVWFKWESYTTWLSGVALLVLVYILGAELYLVDPEVLDLPGWLAGAMALGSLAIGWIAYDRLCKSRLGRHDVALMLALFVVLAVIAWGYTQLFTGRAALLLFGAVIGTIMSANVFFVIIPNQRLVVADLKAGRAPAAAIGRAAKQRSTHNNYFTLPVLFLMFSIHYPLVFTSDYNWVIAALVLLMGVSIRHFFNTMHAGKGMPWWTWGVTAGLFALAAMLSVWGRPLAEAEAAVAPPAPAAAAAGFDEVVLAVQAHCAMCHAAQPFWPGIAAAPGGVVLESEADIAREAWSIYLHAGLSDAMPPATVSFMEEAERAQIRQWYRRASGG